MVNTVSLAISEMGNGSDTISPKSSCSYKLALGMSLYNTTVAAVRQTHANSSRASSRVYFGVERKRIKLRAVAAMIDRPKSVPQVPFIEVSHLDYSIRTTWTYLEGIFTNLDSIGSHLLGEKISVPSKNDYDLAVLLEF